MKITTRKINNSILEIHFETFLGQCSQETISNLENEIDEDILDQLKTVIEDYIKANS